MKLLITGGAGFIGSNYIRYALKEHPEDRIVNLDLLTYAGNLENVCEAAQNPQYSFVQGDIADRAFVFGLFERERFDASSTLRRRRTSTAALRIRRFLCGQMCWARLCCWMPRGRLA